MEEARGDDDQQQGHHVQCLVNALLPVLPPDNVTAILKDRELLAGLHPDLSAEPLAELSEMTVVMQIIEPGVAHEGGRLA